MLFLKLSFSASRSHSLPVPDPYSLPRTKPAPFPAPNTHFPHPAHTLTHRPPKSTLPLLITKKHSPFPAPNTHSPHPAHTPTHPPVKTGAPSPVPNPYSLPRTQRLLASLRSHPDTPARQNRRSSPSYRRLSFQFGHLGTCLFCPFFGHFKHVPQCPKLQDISLSFASFLFLSQIFPLACDFP